jgi:phosphatidylglycerol:prolipoprotein diacylglycerol transferase
MYILGFFAEYHVVKWQSRLKGLDLDDNDVSDYIGHLIMGVVIGGRLGYVLLYNLNDYLADPLKILRVWEGGMAFHGGLVGTILAGWWWCRKKGIRFADMADVTAVGVPIGLAFGRFGNFINGELWGKVTDVPWAMVFPLGGPEPRHPSQLYELILEGFVLLSVLFAYSRWRPPTGALFWTFLAGYGLIRFTIEMFRNPDPQFFSPSNPTGAVLGPLSMGQVLSLPMILAGVGMLAFLYWKRNPKNTFTQPSAGTE